MKVVWFYDEIYRENILFIIGSKGKKIIKYCKKRINVDLPDWRDCGGRCYEITDYGIIIYLQKFDYSPKRFGALTHEIVHGASFILNSRGVKHDSDNNEALTYYTEFLTRKFLELLARQTDRKTKRKRGTK
jgi:hypothetical protein